MLTGEVEFADSFEKALYNAYLGSVNTEKIVDSKTIERLPGAIPVALPFDSYSSLLPNTRGRGIGGLQLMSDKHYYGCCACIGSAGTGMISKVAAMLREDGVALNLYIPGSIVTRTPSAGELKLDVDTLYPVDGFVDPTVGVDSDEEFTIALRIPEWSERTHIAVNGENIPAHKGYCELRRALAATVIVSRCLLICARRSFTLRTSDVMSSSPIGSRVSRSHDRDTAWRETPEAKFHIALRRGPLVLARDARLDGTVDEAVNIAYDDDGYVELEPSDKASFDKIVEFSVPQVNGKKFTVVDCSVPPERHGTSRLSTAPGMPTRCVLEEVRADLRKH